MIDWKCFFIETAEIVALSLANFIVNKRTDTSIYNLCKVDETTESGQFDNLLNCRKRTS